MRSASRLLALLLALLASAASGPTATAEERSGLVLSGLPPHESAAYKSLRKLAGRAQGQPLPLSRAEMWEVPASRVDGLLAAAQAAGVTITRMDTGFDRALLPMRDPQPMTAEQKSMQSMAMDSKAAMNMTMMALPQAGVLEYALTQAPAGKSPARLVLPLAENLTITARRNSVKPASDGLVWQGEVEETGDPVTLMFWPGRLTGTVNYKGRMFSIRSMGGGMHGVVELSDRAMPPEHAPMQLDHMKKMNMKVDPLVTQGDAAKAMSSEPTAAPAGLERGNTRNLEDSAGTLPRRLALKPSEITGGRKKSGRRRAPVTIDLVVAYTREAARRYSDIKSDLIALAVEEANQSFVNSGIGHVRLNVVHIHETDYREAGSHFDHVFQLLQRKDGVMDEIPPLLEQYKADIGVLIVHDPQGCGLAAKVGAERDNAFAVVHQECAATTYSLTHEIGHLIGARHDIALDDSKEPHAYGHGFVAGTRWRTMMSYKESCGGCPRLPLWSNPNIRVRGERAGDAHSNNARVIASQAARIAAFR